MRSSACLLLARATRADDAAERGRVQERDARKIDEDTPGRSEPVERALELGRREGVELTPCDHRRDGVLVKNQDLVHPAQVPRHGDRAAVRPP